MEQGSSSRKHVNRCWIASFSTPHLQITLVNGSVKPHFFSSVFVLATPERRWLRQRHIFHSSCDPRGRLSLGLIFKWLLDGKSSNFLSHASSLQVLIFPSRGSTQRRKLFLDFNLGGVGFLLNNMWRGSHTSLKRSCWLEASLRVSGGTIPASRWRLLVVVGWDSQ